jgi:hypothetical protein
MLAGLEEALSTGGSGGEQEGMTAIESLLSELIDYAGLYPPAALDMHTAVRNYLEYGNGAHKRALGRFVIDLARFPYLWDAAGDYVRNLRLTVIAAPDSDWSEVHRLIDKGYVIESIEIKPDAPEEIASIAEQLPAELTAYFEIPFDASPKWLYAIEASGGRIKLRMGGTAAEAFPSPQSVATMLEELAHRRLVFKATAGLHHAVRGRHAIHCVAGDVPGDATAVMHGFVNLSCAAALLYFGAEASDAQHALEEEWPRSWQMMPEALAWGEYSWNGDELCEVRRQFFAGFGSCSFQEPIEELEAMGWL